MATKKHTNRTSKTHAASELSDTKYFKQRFACSVNDYLSHIRMNILCCIPGILDTDERSRNTIIHYLCDQYREEVKAQLRPGSK